ncbi:MAG TPA: hypothetical protein DCZ95_07895 [Verrucomicrobia bacterium]|nr:MAG: hypothetical protein A2X46_14735 [Lentisphaerae bacterium GWF2_57_35]HBA83998.1 hypothetical protein [Verrucomicrobiota bacterium]
MIDRPACLTLLVLLPLLNLPAPAAEWIDYFSDDFQDNSLTSWTVQFGVWHTEAEDAAHIVLNGEGHSVIGLNSGQDWAQYSFDCRLKLLAGQLFINYRAGSSGRYALRIEESGLYLGKESPWGNFVDLTSQPVELALDAWYNVKVVGISSNLRVYVDDVLKIDYNDPAFISLGSVTLESLDDSHVHVDDVVVMGEPPPTPGYTYVWRKLGGPIGGLGYDVRIHPTNRNIMFVTDNPSGVNKSLDGGASWTKKNEGITSRTGPSLDGIPVFSLTVDPGNPNIVWVGAQNAKGIFKSVDGGETWARKDGGILESDDISFRNFGIHPTNSLLVFAGAEIATATNGIEFNKAQGVIYRTDDGGELWHPVWRGDSLVRFILFDPTNPAVLYASTGIFDREAAEDRGLGLLKSLDGGSNWFQINQGISNLFVGFLEMHPTNSQILFAAAGNNAWAYPPNSLDGEIVRTTNGGVSWQRVLTNDLYTVVTVSRSHPNVVYAGSGTAFYRSADGGDTWQKLWREEDYCWGPPGIRAGVPISAVVDPDDPNTLFVNNYGGGNFKSTNGAANWTDASRGYSGAHLHQIALTPTNPSVVYTIGRSGPFKSVDHGVTWSGIGFGAANYSEWNTVALNPVNPQEVLVTDEHNGVILKSVDGGLDWTEVYRQPDVDASVPTNRHGFKAVCYAPSQPQIVYAGMRVSLNIFNGIFPPRNSYGVYKSTNGGETWQAKNTGLDGALLNINCLVVNPTNADIVYAGSWKDGVYKTVDGGDNWAPANNGLGCLDVRSLAIDPQNQDTIYAGLGEGVGVYKSTDGAQSWAEINQGFNRKCPSYLLPAGKAALGISLEPIPPLRPATDYYSVPWSVVFSVVVDPSNPQNIYAADHAVGIYLSTNGGLGWVPLNQGLSTRAVTSMAISQDGKALYAATEGEGAFLYSPDRDNDRLTDYDETFWGTDYLNPDSDNDRIDDGDEVLCGTSPTNAGSYLGMRSLSRSTGVGGLIVSWGSESNRSYRLERSTNLVAGFAEDLWDRIEATPPLNIHTDATAIGNGPFMYRIGLE